MKNKWKLFVSSLIICTLIPAHFVFANVQLIPDGDGIHMDDIMVHLSQIDPETPPSSTDIMALLNQITPMITLPASAATIAAGITSVTAPYPGGTSVIFPVVPQGYKIAVDSSNKPDVVSISGAITPPAVATVVALSFKVTKVSDNNNFAITATFSVTIPAYELVFIPRPEGSVNVALAGEAKASTTISSFPISSINNGSRYGTGNVFGWGYPSGGWNDATGGSFPDYVQINFNALKTIDEIDVITIQDNFNNPSEPTIDMTFTPVNGIGYGITDYTVMYCPVTENDCLDDGWITVDNGDVKGNKYVWKQFTFAPVETRKIRVLIHKAADGHSRVLEVEAWSHVNPGA